MVERDIKVKIEAEREDLLLRFTGQMFSLMKQIHREIPHQEPMLSPPQARLAFTIATYKDDGISVKELARISDITPGAITQFTDVLIAKKLVTREEDPSDRRSVRLKITPSAKSQMESIRKAFLAAATRKLAVLNTDDLRQLNVILAKAISEPLDKDNV